MFKKLKDKIEEEIKQTPLRLPIAVQQFAQALSPAPSEKSLNENANNNLSQLPDTISVSSDFFSIGDEPDSSRTQQTTSLSSLVLNSTRSRRSSISSVASDVSSLFPVFESSMNHHSFQSDLESELDEGVTQQLEKVSKERLYQAYKKLLSRCQKYKGRWADLSRNYKDLQAEHLKIKHVLQESQDKNVRRLAELREQCLLEQKAKAHLEESLRSDLEEKDHVIDTLNTKITLLRNGNVVDAIETIAKRDGDDGLKEQIRELENEVRQLKRSSESSTVREKIDELKTGIVQLKEDNENLSNWLLSKSPSASISDGSDSGTLIDFADPNADERDRKIDKLNQLLLKCKKKVHELNGEVQAKGAKVLQLENELSVAKKSIEKFEENIALIKEQPISKIDAECEAKEETIKSLKKQLEANEAATVRLARDFHTQVEAYLSLHQEQLIAVVQRVETKLLKAQENIMVTTRNYVAGSEAAIRCKMLDLDREKQETAEWRNKTEKFLNNVEHLKVELTESQRVLLTRDETIQRLTKEINEKIDRLVELGDEMERLRESHALQVSGLEAQVEQKTRLNEESAGKSAMLEQSCESLRIQFSQLNQQLIEAELHKQQVIQDLKQLNDTKLDLEKQLRKKCQEYETVAEDLDHSRHELETAKAKLDATENINKDLEEKIKGLDNLADIESVLEKKTNELKELETEKQRWKQQEEENNDIVQHLKMQLDELKTEQNKNQSVQQEEMAQLENDHTSKLNILKNEIRFLKETHLEELSRLESNRQSDLERVERTCGELLEKLERISQERDELSAQCQEKVLQLAEMQAYVNEMKMNLDNGSRYEVELTTKNELIKDLELRNTENEAALESLKSLRSTVKNLQQELKEKDDLLETKIEELEELKRTLDNVRLNTKIDCEDSLEESKRNYNTKLTEMEVKLRKDHEEQLALMEKENQLREKQLLKEKTDLESTSKIAVAAMQSTNETIDLLRREILLRTNELTEVKRQHKREILELQKVLSIRDNRVRRECNSEGDQEDMEHEYLRNILYEYMMGREPMVLAKVLAAIVKFDKQQTNNVLERQLQLMNQIRIL